MKTKSFHRFTQISQSYEKHTILSNMLEILAYYAGIMLNAFATLLCSKLCWHIGSSLLSILDFLLFHIWSQWLIIKYDST